MADGIYRIGANIKNGDLFEGLWPIPDGVSLNSYVVKGEKNALIDLVRDWDNAPVQLMNQLAAIGLNGEKIDYLILNHLEPDHTGWLGEFHTQFPNAEIITSKKGVALVKSFYKFDDGVRAVGDGDSLDLGGGRNLQFFDAPNVHWPETMVTYEPESGILFSCDAFGSYGSLGDAVFDDELSQEKHEFYEKEALRYYANIVSSFSVFVERAIKKLAGLKISMIAPSHGIIWRESPQTIIERYSLYARYMNDAEPEITLIWGSMYGNTRKAVNAAIQGARSEGVIIHSHQAPNENVSYALASAWKSRGLIFGMPTYEYRMFPPIAHVIDMFDRKHVHHKKVFRFGAYGWSGGAQKEFDTLTEKIKWDFLEPVEWAGGPAQTDLDLVYQRAAELARMIKGEIQ